MVRKILFYVIIGVLTTTEVWGQEPRSDHFDTALEYVPYATVFALKACGVESQDNWTRLVATTAASLVVTAGITTGLKHTVHEWRPDHSDRKSFPSGHSAIAFTGATVLHHEYGHLSPWISIGGYAVATFTAVDRVLRDRHHWHDVAVGAGIGFLSTELTYYVANRLFPRRQVNLAFTGTALDVRVRL